MCNRYVVVNQSPYKIEIKHPRLRTKIELRQRQIHRVEAGDEHIQIRPTHVKFFSRVNFVLKY